MGCNDVLRLAWQAQRDGRKGTCDALLTLALAESGPADAAWASLCWKRLRATRSDHLFTRFANLDAALADARGIALVGRLREAFPAARVERQLLRNAALRGIFTGRKPSMRVVLAELFGTSQRRPARLSDPSLPAPLLPLETRPAPPKRPQKAPAATAPASPAPAEDPVPTFYLTVLLAIAILLATTLKATGQGTSKAA